MLKQRKRIPVGGNDGGSSEFVNRTDERPGVDDLLEKSEQVKRKNEIDNLFRAILSQSKKPRRVDSCGC